ncbi:MAG TPA: fibrinogen-binding adhesin SdrG C-terminal domain-containing protein [Limosilactobacillus coleohominis]|nr:fibrinogen-binding adhesin SdrG C-terminal domain-containing protein [Limosilactobacillus coleohominis]
MVSQNNHRMKQQRLLATNQVFSLRKLSIGFVSVVLGLFFACGTDVVGHAATTQPTTSNGAASISMPTKNTLVTPTNGQPQRTQSLVSAKSNGQPVAQAAVADQKTAKEGSTSQTAPVQNVQIQMATTDKNDPHLLRYSQLYGNEPLVVTVSGEISPTAKAGDTFSVNFSDNIRRSDTDEASANNGKQSANPIKDSNGNQIAYGYVDANEDKITYVLLPIVENESNIKFSTSNYFYPQIMKIPNSGTVDAVITVGDQTKHFPLNIQYDNLQQNDAQYGFSARIYDIDFSNGKYKVNAYFNAQNKPLDNQRIEIWARGDNNTDLNPKNSTFRIYRVKDGKTLNASLIPNYSEYDDITNQLKISTNEADAETPGILYYDAATNTVKINFGGKQDSNAYILHFEGQSPIKNGKVHPGMNMHILASRMTLNFSFGSLPAKASASGQTADQLAIVRFKGDASVAKDIQLPKSKINEGVANQAITFDQLASVISQLEQQHLNVVSVTNDSTGQTIAQGANVDWQKVFGNYDNDKYSTQTFTITVGAQKQKASVTFFDDNTKQNLSIKHLTGNGGTTDPYRTAQDLQNYENQGYEFVSDDYPKTGVQYDQDYNTDQNYTVHLKHGQTTVSETTPGTVGQPINPKDPTGPKYTTEMGKDALKHDVTQTIEYVYADGKPTKQPTSTKRLQFTATKTIDKVTGKVLQTEWSPAQNFTTVKSPVIEGYTPDIKQVTDANIDHNHADIKHVVKYSPNEQTIIVKYIDDDVTTDQPLATKTLTGESDSTSPYTTAQSIIDYENKGYELVTDGTQGKTLTFDHDDQKKQTYEVHLKHGIQTVTATDNQQPGKAINPQDPNGAKYPNGVDKNSLTRTVNRMIKYVYSDGTTAEPTYQDHQTYTATVKVDKVTGKVIRTDWSAPQSYPLVKTPKKAGYTPNLTIITDSNIPYNHPAISHTVIYRGDPQTITIKYVDDTTSDPLTTVTKHGTSDEKTGYRTDAELAKLLAQHYVLVNDPTNGQELVFDHQDQVDQNYVVYVKHGTKQVSRASQHRRTINFVDRQTGRQLRPSIVQTITMTQVGTEDLVTKQITWDPVAPQAFSSLTVPEVPGYRILGSSMVGPTTVQFTDQDMTVNVEYDAVPVVKNNPNVTTGITNPAEAQRSYSQANLTNSQQLPQTGNRDQTALVGLGLAFLVGLFGIGRKKKES